MSNIGLIVVFYRICFRGFRKYFLSTRLLQKVNEFVDEAITEVK
ncbi:MAG: hypothetical protein ACFFBZ_07990 [Promethearchaeota archaeon]